MNFLTEIRLQELPQQPAYLRKLPVLHALQRESLTLEQPVTFFVGENGSGKSTLLEAIAVALGYNAEGGSRDTRFSTKATHSPLYQSLGLVRRGYPLDGFFLRAESFYNTASYLDETSTLARYGGISLHAQSHGESFLSLMTHRFTGNGLYLLDEPEAALSTQRLLSLLVLIDELVQQNAQFLIATHSPIILAYPNAEIVEFSEKGLHKIAYRDTDSYRLTKEFLDNPERMLRYLLGR